ncbi:MAG: hypothetical protein IK064_03925 [Clostridia bacterium]|nr:hypothetical protein [Clostridia bacterium]
MVVKRNLLTAGIIAAAAILVMAFYVFVISPKLVEPADTYSNAVKLYNSGDYTRAAMQFESLKTYSDAEKLALDAWKLAGDTAFENGNYHEASACYTRCGSKEDVKKIDDCFLHLAEEEFDRGDMTKAELYLGCLSSDTDEAAVDSMRIAGVTKCLENVADKENIERAAQLLKLCSDDRGAEIAGMFTDLGEKLLEKLDIEPATAAFTAANSFCPEAELPSLQSRMNGAWSAAAALAENNGDHETAERCRRMVTAAEEPVEKDEEDEARYEQAAALFDSGDLVGALEILNTVTGNYPRISAIRSAIEAKLRSMPAAGGALGYALLDPNGNVQFIGSGWNGQQSWSGVKLLDVGLAPFAVGVAEDGTVLAAGDGEFGRLDVEGWTDIVAVACGARHTVGLRSDGTVVACGSNEHSQLGINALSGVSAVAAGRKASYAVMNDGTVHAYTDDNAIITGVASWGNIVAVSGGYAHAAAIDAEGRAFACGNDASGQCQVSGWNDIIMISAGAYHTVGLRADGTLVACGSNDNGECEVSGLKDVVSVSCGYGYTLVVFRDGSYTLLGSMAEE